MISLQQRELRTGLHDLKYKEKVNAKTAFYIIPKVIELHKFESFLVLIYAN